MYDLIDRPIRELPAFERRILDLTRRWVHAYSLAGAGQAEDPLSVAMRALDEGSSAELVIQRPCFATVDETEAVLIALWRMMRDRQTGPARALAEALVTPAHAAVLLDGIAEALSDI